MQTSSNYLENVNAFLDLLIQEATSVGIDVQDLKIDHIAISTGTSEEYEKTLPELLANGTLVNEAIISNRRVAVIKLNDPIGYKNSQITAVELIEPKKGETTKTGWEHAEFLVNSYDTILKKYPELLWDTKDMQRENFSRIKLKLPSGLEIKFLDTPVLASVAKDLG
ncbi:VOC family protein [Patescibacteria group bacterium]|nr:VOC family protein [Patescibacteria group bacterium]